MCIMYILYRYYLHNCSHQIIESNPKAASIAIIHVVSEPYIYDTLFTNFARVYTI